MFILLIYILFSFYLVTTGRYRPFLEVSYVTSELAFSNEEECLTWLRELNLSFSEKDADSKIDAKASMAVLGSF